MEVGRHIFGLTLASLLIVGQSAWAGSIFDGTPFEGAANAGCRATGTCNLQQKAGLPNVGGAVGNFWERAKKDAGPLVTTITTLNCPGCVVAAGVISGPGAVQDALFTTGVITAAYEISPALGLVAIVILGADKDSGEVGYEQVTIAQDRSVHLPTPKVYSINADCLIRDGESIFALWTGHPPSIDAIRNGDTVNIQSPACKQVVSKGAISLTQARIKKSGGNPINMSKGRFQYVMTGEKI